MQKNCFVCGEQVRFERARKLVDGHSRYYVCNECKSKHRIIVGGGND